MKNLFKASPALVCIPRSEHGISRKLISEPALKVLYRLKKAGFESYLVGGGVRDLLLGKRPKDFDVATNATPEQIRKLFNNCRLVGRRFRLAHIYFGRDIIEVATFRKGHKLKDPLAQNEAGMIVCDNVYGTLKEDALRRDFTMNALYYNIRNFEVYDYCEGTQDIKLKCIRSIGSPKIRFREDPVRMLRAIRFSAKLNFELDDEIIFAIASLHQMINHVPPARLFEEIQKLFLCGESKKCLNLLLEHQLIEKLLPPTFACLTAEDIKESQKNMLLKLCEKTDRRIRNHQRVTVAYIFAGFLWHAVCYEKERIESARIAEFPAMFQSIESVLNAQSQAIAIPKRFMLMMKDIWVMQIRLQKRQGSKTEQLINHPKFRAAYDFLLLRAEINSNLQELANWWTTFIDADEEERKTMIKELTYSGRKKLRKRYPRKKNKSTEHNDKNNSEEE